MTLSPADDLSGPPTPGAGSGAGACPALTVYYDGACPLCAAEIGLYRRTEGAEHVRFVDVNRQDCALPAGLTREQARARFHVSRADGAVIGGAAGFIALWLSLPRWRWLGRIAAVPPVSLLLEGVYRLFLVVRPLLQRAFRAMRRDH